MNSVASCGFLSWKGEWYCAANQKGSCQQLPNPTDIRASQGTGPNAATLPCLGQFPPFPYQSQSLPKSTPEGWVPLQSNSVGFTKAGGTLLKSVPCASGNTIDSNLIKGILLLLWPFHLCKKRRRSCFIMCSPSPVVLTCWHRDCWAQGFEKMQQKQPEKRPLEMAAFKNRAHLRAWQLSAGGMINASPSTGLSIKVTG